MRLRCYICIVGFNILGLAVVIGYKMNDTRATQMNLGIIYSAENRAQHTMSDISLKYTQRCTDRLLTELLKAAPWPIPSMKMGCLGQVKDVTWCWIMADTSKNIVAESRR